MIRVVVFMFVFLFGVVIVGVSSDYLVDYYCENNCRFCILYCLIFGYWYWSCLRNLVCYLLLLY